MFRVKEAAEKLGISPSKLYQMAQRREISHLRVPPPNGRILFTQADLDAYLARCRVEVSRETRDPAKPTAFTMLDGKRLTAAWQRQGVPVARRGRTDNAPSSE